MGQQEVSSQRPSASIYNDRRSSWDLIHLITYYALLALNHWVSEQNAKAT